MIQGDYTIRGYLSQSKIGKEVTKVWGFVALVYHGFGTIKRTVWRWGFQDEQALPPEAWCQRCGREVYRLGEALCQKCREEGELEMES